MVPIEHKFANMTLNAPAGQEADVLPLRVYTDGEQCISCWKLTWRERLPALAFGRVWLSVLSGRTQPPVWLLATREALKEEGETSIPKIRLLWNRMLFLFRVYSSVRESEGRLRSLWNVLKAAKVIFT